MKILYTRVSTILQNTERQVANSSEYDLLIEDKCSGKIPLFEREGGARLKKLIEEGKVSSVIVHQTDRLGRDLLDILQTIQFCNERKICIFFKQQNLRTLDDNGNEDTIAKLVISMLATFADIERKISRERVLEGIAIAKAAKRYKGRLKGTKESALDFLSKPTNKKAIELLKKGYKGKEIAKILGMSVNTITKIKKISKI
jgi:DNA invertase Pin-like site-specific DNA recombinase